MAEWPFGRGPTTPVVGGLTVVANYLLHTMILQAMPPQEITPYSGIMMVNNPSIMRAISWGGVALGEAEVP